MRDYITLFQAHAIPPMPNGRQGQTEGLVAPRVREAPRVDLQAGLQAHAPKRALRLHLRRQAPQGPRCRDHAQPRRRVRPGEAPPVEAEGRGGVGEAAERDHARHGPGRAWLQEEDALPPRQQRGRCAAPQLCVEGRRRQRREAAGEDVGAHPDRRHGGDSGARSAGGSSVGVGLSAGLH